MQCLIFTLSIIYLTHTIVNPHFVSSILQKKQKNGYHVNTIQVLTQFQALPPPTTKKHNPLPTKTEESKILPTAPSFTPSDTPKQQNLSHIALDRILDSSAFPIDIPVRSDICKIGLMWPHGLDNFHPTAPLLHSYSIKCCSVNYGPT